MASISSGDNKRIAVTVAIVAAVTAIAIYLYHLPMDGGALRCPFKALTGWDCPGCGFQRGMHALLHGHVIDALRLNALSLLVAPLAVGVIVLEIWRDRFPKLYNRIHSPKALISILVITLAWWILRNV